MESEPRSSGPGPRRPPPIVGGTSLVLWTPIDQRHRPTGSCAVHRSQRLGPPAGLAICRSAEGYYLFGCDRDWNTLTDTWHESLEDARDQAELEFEGVSATWSAA